LSGEIKLSNIINNLKITSIGTFFGKISGLALKFFVAKFLGAEGLGLYVLLNLIIPYYSYFFLGASDILPREIPQLQVKKNDVAISKMRSIVNIFFITISILLTAVFISYMLFFYDQNVSKFDHLSLIFVFLTAVFSQFGTLMSKHIKSIGLFSKLYINESTIKIISPWIAILFIFQYGLNGYLFANLLFAFLNLSNFIYYNYKNNLNLLKFNYFSWNSFVRNIKLGIAMYLNQNFNKGLFVILITYIGVKFSEQTVGEIGFIVMMLDVIKPLFKPYFSSSERIIYLTKESPKDKFTDLLNMSIMNTLLFGITIQLLAIFLKYIIPILFIDFIPAISIIPILSLLFFVRNSIILINFYLNSYRMYYSRNVISITLLLSFVCIARLPLFETNIKYLLILFILTILIYKIVIHLFANKIFNKMFSMIKLIFFDFLSSIIVFLSTIAIIGNQDFIFKDIGIFLMSTFILFILYLKNPTIFLKQTRKFFN
tara:strand:+ start:4669 stop:6126 length:1458 start_codon:yes stop_codon:yes gene_type:complete